MNCPCCKKIVSIDAQSCPNCGKNIQRYVNNITAPHGKAITKAQVKIGISIFILVITTLVLIACSTFFSMQSSLYFEISELAPEEYAGDIQRTATVFSTIAVIGWVVTLTVFVLLFLKTRKTMRKQQEIIAKEKASLIFRK